MKGFTGALYPIIVFIVTFKLIVHYLVKLSLCVNVQNSHMYAVGQWFSNVFRIVTPPLPGTTPGVDHPHVPIAMLLATALKSVSARIPGNCTNCAGYSLKTKNKIVVAAMLL